LPLYSFAFVILVFMVEFLDHFFDKLVLYEMTERLPSSLTLRISCPFDFVIVTVILFIHFPIKDFLDLI